MSLMLTATPGVALEGTVTVTGSNTVFPIIEAASARWQELHPDVTISASGPGSGAGITALIEGQTDLAPMSRAPKAAEISEATTAGIELNITTVGIDAIVIIVNKNNPITDLTSDQISQIYNGTFTSWTEVGWSAGGDITVIERDENSGTHDYFNDQFMGGEEVNPALLHEHKQEASTSTLFQLVAENDNAIGYGGLAYLDDTVKAVDVDGVKATKANAKSGDYSVARPLFVVFDDKTVSDLAREFINYILGLEGQYLVDSVGYVAVGEMAESLEAVAGFLPLNMTPIFLGIAAVTAIGILRRKN